MRHHRHAHGSRDCNPHKSHIGRPDKRGPNNGYKTLRCVVEPRQVLVRTPNKAASAAQSHLPRFAPHPERTHFG